MYMLYALRFVSKIAFEYFCVYNYYCHANKKLPSIFFVKYIQHSFSEKVSETIPFLPLTHVVFLSSPFIDTPTDHYPTTVRRISLTILELYLPGTWVVKIMSACKLSGLSRPRSLQQSCSPNYCFFITSTFMSAWHWGTVPGGLPGNATRWDDCGSHLMY